MADQANIEIKLCKEGLQPIQFVRRVRGVLRNRVGHIQPLIFLAAQLVVRQHVDPQDISYYILGYGRDVYMKYGDYEHRGQNRSRFILTKLGDDAFRQAVRDAVAKAKAEGDYRLTIEEEKIGAFRKAINDWAAKEYPVPKPLPLKLDAVADIAELTVPTVQELSRLAPFGSGNPVPVFLLQNAAVDGIWPLGNEGRHCRIRLRQGGAACFVSLFGTAPDDLPYRMGTAVDAAVEVSIFQGRGGPMVSCHCCAMRPAGLGNAPAEQAARFDAFLSGTALPDDERLACLPTRADTAAVYRMVRTGNVFADDLQPLFATAGPENTGKTLASLTALEQLGLIERRGSRYQPVEVTGKKDLSSAPVLRRLAEGEG